MGQRRWTMESNWPVFPWRMWEGAGRDRVSMLSCPLIGNTSQWHKKVSELSKQLSDPGNVNASDMVWRGIQALLIISTFQHSTWFRGAKSHLNLRETSRSLLAQDLRDMIRWEGTGARASCEGMDLTGWDQGPEMKNIISFRKMYDSHLWWLMCASRVCWRGRGFTRKKVR